MKPRSSVKVSAARRQAAFTLIEITVTMGLFIFVVAGVISSHMFCLRLFQIIKPKLTASDEARATVAKLTEEIRTANRIRIGSGTLSTFAEVSANTPQIGSAIQIYPSTNTNTFVRYFWDASDNKLKRSTNGASSAWVVANSVSNQLVFTSEDFAGNVLTNNINNRVIGLNLQFYQILYPTVTIGPGGMYDFYQLRTKITRRTLL
jgi:hypothetical protein